MAISSENLSVSGVQNILQLGEAAYADLLGDNSQVDMLEAALLRIQNLITMLKSLESQMCSKLGVEDINAFKQKYDEAINTLNLNKLTGAELKSLYVDAFAKAAGKFKNEDKKIEMLAQAILDELVQSSSLDKLDIDDLTKKLHGILLDAVVTESGCKVDLRALTRAPLIGNTDEGPKIIAEAMTPTIKKRLTTLLNLINSNKKFDRQDYLMLDKIRVSQFKGMDDPIEIKLDSKWFELTQGMTENTFKEFLKENKKEAEALRKTVNDELTLDICSKLGLSGDNEVKKAIQTMLRQEKNMFFIGSAPTEVTGLLGEIAAYAALKKAFGSKVKLRWAAQALEGGKQLSIDIVLNEIFGVQVKNTTYDLNQMNYAIGNIAGHGIDFVDKSAYDVIQQLTDSDALGRSYETSYFNISYTINHDNEPHVVAGSSPDFDNIANGLVSLREKIEQFLLTFSPELVYMANNGPLKTQLATLESSLQNLRGNILYLVGNQPVFASEMLGRIETQISNLIKEIHGHTVTTPENALKISASKSNTIVKYLNERAANGQQIGLEKQGALVGVKTIKLTSSYRF